MEKAINRFLDYTNEYLEIDFYHMNLKIEHTFRVMDLCEEIAKSLNLTEEEIGLARLCGLLHDIGRFEQWRRYQTFSDSKSIDHGNLGVDLLKEDQLMRIFHNNLSLDSLILNVVKYHNKYEIPNSLSEKEKLFCNIVRDADKIDILYLYSIDEVEIDTKNTSFSEEVFTSLHKHKLLKRSQKKTAADTLAISLGFVFDLNFKKSFEILKEAKYIDIEIDINKKKTKNKELQSQLEQLREEINCYIDRRCRYVR